MKPEQIEWLRSFTCDVKDCKNTMGWAVRFKGDFSSYVVCEKCLLETAQAMVMNMGV
jgi:hypothetical protein